MTKGITTLILVSFLSLCTCKNDNYTLLTKNYFNTYETKSFEELASFLSDTITIIDGDYQKSYSIKEFQIYFEWDSVFNPQFDITKISSSENNIFLTVSSRSNRFEYLGDNPFVTKQKISFRKNKIYKIEILENIDIDWKLWTSKRDTLVKWIDNNHPELSGFINDMTKEGAENYLKAIDLYHNKDRHIH